MAPFNQDLFKSGERLHGVKVVPLAAGGARSLIHQRLHATHLELIIKWDADAMDPIYVAVAVRMVEPAIAALQGGGDHITVCYINSFTHRCPTSDVHRRIKDLCMGELESAQCAFFAPSVYAQFAAPRWYKSHDTIVVNLDQCPLAECVANMQELICLFPRRRKLVPLQCQCTIACVHVQLHPKRSHYIAWKARCSPPMVRERRLALLAFHALWANAKKVPPMPCIGSLQGNSRMRSL